VQHGVHSRSFFPMLVILLLTTPDPLPAYVDPGSGSFLIQMLIAGVLGASVTLKTFWKQIKSYFRRSDSSIQK
jgi:hypothetical protein